MDARKPSRRTGGLALTAVLTLACVQSPAAQAAIYSQISDDTVLFEAENYTQNVATAAGSWDLRSEADSSGGVAVYSHNIKSFGDDFLNDSPRLDYELNLQPGTYHIWLRALMRSSGSNSSFAGLRGDGSNSHVVAGSIDDRYYWVTAGPKRTIEIASSGVHTFSLWVREDDMIVDQIVLTRDSTFAPPSRIALVTDGSSDSADGDNSGEPEAASTSSDSAGAAESASSSGSIVAVDDYMAVDANADKVRFYQMTNDSGYNANNFKVSIVQQPRYADRIRLTTSQDVVYFPKPGFVGRDSLVYRVTDGSGASAEAMITVDVGCAPCEDGSGSGSSGSGEGSETGTESPSTPVAAIVAVDDYVTAIANEDKVRVHQMLNDSGYDANSLQVSIVEQPKHASRVRVTSSQDVVYFPQAGFVGRDSLVYEVTDASGNRARAQITFDVGCAPCETAEGGDGGGSVPSRILLTWNPNPELVEGYVVHFGPSGETAILQVATIDTETGTLDPNLPSVDFDPASDLGLNSGDQACFRVRAFNEAGLSDFSNSACSTM